jgi:hypothetical protein
LVSLAQISQLKPCIHLSLIRATCSAHLILLDFITRTILGEGYRSINSSLCSFLHSPVTSSLLVPNIILNTLFSNTLQHTFLPQCERPSFTPIQNNRQNCSSVHINPNFVKTVEKYRTLYVKIRYVSDCWQEYRLRHAVLAWQLS